MLGKILEQTDRPEQAQPYSAQAGWVITGLSAIICVVMAFVCGGQRVIADCRTSVLRTPYIQEAAEAYLRGGIVLLRSARTRHGLPAPWLEALVLAAGYALYQFVQILVAGSRRSAVDRATWLWSTEQHLHVDPEVWLNHLVAERYWLVVVAGLYYGTLHFAVTPLVLVWLRARRPDGYVSLRNTLVGTSVAALIVYWLLPLAPPRLSVPVVVDTMKVHDILSAGSPSGLAALANQYAAMPSLHVAWAVWVALAVVIAFPSSQVRHLAWAYPVSTTLVVMATGHHFLADAVAAALLVWAAWAVSLALGPGGRGDHLLWPDMPTVQQTEPG